MSDTQKIFATETKHIKAGLISSDMRYQRKVTGRVKRIASNYDPNKLNAIIVSQRADGTFWVIDGQHRLQATVLKCGKDTKMLCIVYYGMTPEEEADMFASQHDNVKAPTKGEFFKAKAFAGDKDVIRFKEATEAEGIECDFGVGRKTDGKLSALGAAYEVYMTYGEIPYRRVLQVLADSWGGDGDTLTANFIRGMSIFMRTYPDIDTEKLSKALKKVSPSEIEREAKVSSSGGAKRYARQFLRVYNKGRRANALEDKII